MSEPTTFFRSASTAAVLLTVALVGAACGSSPESEAQLPSLDGGDGAENAAATSDDELTEAEMGRILEDYRECMLEALPAGSEVNVSLGPDGPSIDVSSSADGDDDAVAECESMLAELERSFLGDAEQIAARKSQSEAALQCLFDRGYENSGVLNLAVDDQSGYLSVDINGDLDEEQYERDEQECLAEAGFED